MDIKSILKKEGITQDEFASHLGQTRVGVNKSLKQEPSKERIHSLKILVAQKRGVAFDIDLSA